MLNNALIGCEVLDFRSRGEAVAGTAAEAVLEHTTLAIWAALSVAGAVNESIEALTTTLVTALLRPGVRGLSVDDFQSY